MCTQFRSENRASLAASFDCDSDALVRLGQVLTKVAVPEDSPLPSLDDLDAAMSAVQEVTTSWRKRAAAQRGEPGHFPMAGSPHPKPH